MTQENPSPAAIHRTYKPYLPWILFILESMTELKELANYLEKLGNPTRLAIVRLLIRVGPEGLSVGALQEHLGIPASTLSHHLMFLSTSELILQERAGRVIRCAINMALLKDLVQALMSECCVGISASKQVDSSIGFAGRFESLSPYDLIE